MRQGVCGHYAGHCTLPPTRPLKRVGERGSGQFEEISWEEALGIATDWLGPLREKSPKAGVFHRT